MLCILVGQRESKLCRYSICFIIFMSNGKIFASTSTKFYISWGNLTGSVLSSAEPILSLALKKISMEMSCPIRVSINKLSCTILYGFSFDQKVGCAVLSWFSSEQKLSWAGEFFLSFDENWAELSCPVWVLIKIWVELSCPVRVFSKT